MAPPTLVLQTTYAELLDRCAAADIHFLRFSEKDRTDCYKTSHLEGGTINPR